MAPASKFSLRSSVQTFPLHCNGVVTNPGQGRTLHNQNSHQQSWVSPSCQSVSLAQRQRDAVGGQETGWHIGSLQSPAPPAAEEGRDGRP